MDALQGGCRLSPGAGEQGVRIGHARFQLAAAPRLRGCLRLHPLLGTAGGLPRVRFLFRLAMTLEEVDCGHVKPLCLACTVCQARGLWLAEQSMARRA